MYFIIECIPVLITLLFCWSHYKSLYWRLRKIPSIDAMPLLGNICSFVTLRKSLGLIFNDIYFDAKSPFVGIHIFYKPAILIKDPQLIGRIMIKDFASFQNRYARADEHRDMLGATNIAFIKNPRWKHLRTRFMPFFSIARLRDMFYLVKKVGDELDEIMLTTRINDHTKAFSIDLKYLSSYYTTDVIANCVFGIGVNSLKYPQNDFLTNGKKIFKFTIFRALETFCVFFFPEVVSFFRLKVFSKESCSFLRDSISRAMKEREESGYERDDLIDTLISLKNEDKFIAGSPNNLVLDGDVLVAQAALFYLAGYDTSSTSIAFTLYELCWNQEIQTRLRADIKHIFDASNGDPSYDDIESMAYLSMVIQETQRMYPVISFLDRECTNENGYSLQPYHDFVIPKGMQVIVPIYALQRDPKYFPDPDIFDPERFSIQNRQNIHPNTFLPFGMGPRACVGIRFGLMMVKIGLVYFLKNHYVEPSEETPHELELETNALFTQPKGGIKLNVIRDRITK